MKFLYPSFLSALVLVAIPIIVHLFNFRKYKRIYFSDITFLKEVQEETKSKQKLKHILILISRILFISFLVFAFAQPFIPPKNNTVVNGKNAVSIYIDNSFSMEANGNEGRLLDKAIRTAEEIAKAYKPSDRFQLLTNDFEGKQQRLLSRDEFMEALSSVKISAVFRDIKEVSSRQRDVLLGPEAHEFSVKSAFQISDFQNSYFKNVPVNKDSLVNFQLVPIAATEVNNLYIDTAYLKTPLPKLNEPTELLVKVCNKSNNVIENKPLKLFINNQQKAIATINAEKDECVEVTLNFTLTQPGNYNCSVSMDDYPITYDDKFYFSLSLAKNINTLVINGKDDNKYLQSFFTNDTYFNTSYFNDKKLDYSVINNSNLVVLNELSTISGGLSSELNQFVAKGGSILIFPPSDKIDLPGYQQFLTSLNSPAYNTLDTANTKVNRINFDNELFKDVFELKELKKSNAIDLPVVTQHYPLSISTNNTSVKLMELLNGDVLLTQANYGKGKVYAFSVPLSLSFGNLPKHAVLVPTLYKIAFTSLSAMPLYYTIGSNQPIAFNYSAVGDDVIKIKSLLDNTTLIPDNKKTENGTILNISNLPITAGNYIGTTNDQPLQALSFNFDRKESNPACLNAGQINNFINENNLTNISVVDVQGNNLTYTIQAVNEGSKLWKLCILLSLVFILVEILLIRFYKA